MYTGVIDHTSMRKRTTPFFSSRFYLISILLFLLLLDAFVLWYASKRDYDRTIERAQLVLQKTSISLEERVKRTVVATEAILRNRAQRIQEVGIEKTVSSAKERERFQRAAEGLPDEGSLWLLDDSANLLLDSTQYPSQPLNFSEREYFALQRDKGIQLYIGPIIKGKITNKYSFTISQRINGENGRFLGIIVAAIDTDSFTDFLRNIDIGKGSTVTVFRTDGALILRQPMQDEYLGKIFTHLKLFTTPLDKSSSGIYESRAIDGTLRLIAYRKMHDFPLLVATGVPVSSVLQEWRMRLKTNSLLAASIFLALLCLSLVVRRTVAREEKERTKALSDINDSLQTEITERKRAVKELLRAKDELELRVSERTDELQRALQSLSKGTQRLYEVLETLPAYVALLAPDYRMPFTNRVFRDLFGDPGDKKCFEHLFGRTEPCEICQSYEVLKISKPQQWQWTGPNGRTYDIHDYPFTDTDGSPLILEMGMDMTDRMRAQEEIRFAYAYNRSLIEASIDPLVTINPRGLISDVNMATEHVTGYARDELIGTDFCDYFTDREKAKAGYKQVFRDGIVRDYELEILHKDGRTTPVLYNASVYRGESGNVIGVFAAARDVTEQRRLEDQLRHSQKMEAIGTLAGGIAHDFNNILAAIIGFAEMVEEDIPFGKPKVEHVQRVINAASRGRELVQKILAFSRKTERARHLVSLSAIIKETAQLLRASIPTTIEIILDMAATSDTILATPVEVQQVLMNLSTNASLSMQEKGGILKLIMADINIVPDSPLLEANMAPGEYVQLVVADTGTGMTPDVIERIFEPFFTTREVGQGTGMGLAVVYGIVKSLHGSIRVESEPGVGSTFTILFPKAQADVFAEKVTTEQSSGNNERVLFVDDEESLVEWGKALLERLGYEVIATNDSTKALEVFTSDPSMFDLVITDQTMPGITGLELAREFLRIRPEIPIILCTGHSSAVTFDKLEEPGVREFLMKPLTRKELAEAIRRVLDKEKKK